MDILVLCVAQHDTEAPPDRTQHNQPPRGANWKLRVLSAATQPQPRRNLGQENMKASLCLCSCDLYPATFSKQDNCISLLKDLSRSPISKSSWEKRITHTQAHNSLQLEKNKLLEILFFLLGSINAPSFSSTRSAWNTKLYPDISRLRPLVPPLLKLCHCTCEEYKIPSSTALVPVL